MRDKVYRLKVMHSTRGYLLARSEHDGPINEHLTVLLSPITIAWLRQQFPWWGIIDATNLADQLDRKTARVT